VSRTPDHRCQIPDILTGPHLDPKTADAGTCAERAFLMEMMGPNPEAFSSDLDVQRLACLYRCKS